MTIYANEVTETLFQMGRRFVAPVTVKRTPTTAVGYAAAYPIA